MVLVWKDEWIADIGLHKILAGTTPLWVKPTDGRKRRVAACTEQEKVTWHDKRREQNNIAVRPQKGNPADEQVILFSAISSSDNLRLGIQLGLGLVRVSVSIDCGSYFYISNTRNVYFTMAK